jgi:hypothetical protein
MSTAEYLSMIVTGPNGEEWQQQARVVPRIGDSVTVRQEGTMKLMFGGRVKDVHWGLVEGRPGAVASVWLEKNET